MYPEFAPLLRLTGGFETLNLKYMYELVEGFAIGFTCPRCFKSRSMDSTGCGQSLMDFRSLGIDLFKCMICEQICISPYSAINKPARKK
jgi:hypothetical protein